jgi:hypothetical protein
MFPLWHLKGHHLNVNNIGERMWKQTVMPKIRYYPNIYLEVLLKTMKSLNQDSQCPSQDSNWAPPEYKLPLQPLCLVLLIIIQLFNTT